ncbi:MAG: S1 RNA-binding domain-containing protein [Eubacteriales bacterium]|nr:S1 RNA-binding domain-containing protein [Eubacteriales bacterium]
MATKKQTEQEMDLNEVLSITEEASEDMELSETQETELPELSEAELFGDETASEEEENDTVETDGDAAEETETLSLDAEMPIPNEESSATVVPESTAVAKLKRGGRRKKAETSEENTAKPAEIAEMESAGPETADAAEPESNSGDFHQEAAPKTAAMAETPVAAPRRQTSPRKTEVPVLTLESRSEVETEESREDAIWHEIHNAYRTRRILTGQLGGIEQTDTGKTIAIADYKGFRIVIPLKEMMINVGRSPSGQEYAELMLRQNKILGNMLGAEIDFIVRGIDSKSRSVVASRREAMLKKRQIFYMDTDSAGLYRIYDGRIVQARVIAVAEKVVRVEVFGVECSIMARDLAWDWIGDAHERFSVGDQVLVRILNVRRDSLEEIGIRADIKSVSQNTSHDNLRKCRVQSKYAGKVTDVHKGVVYIRLSNGVNAVAHSCYDYRTPGKKDDVSFAVTRLDEERGVAVGIITRIIRQNL